MSTAETGIFRKKFGFLYLLLAVILCNCSAPIHAPIANDDPSPLAAITPGATVVTEQIFSTFTPVQPAKTSPSVSTKPLTPTATQPPTLTPTTDFSRLRIQTATPGPAAQCVPAYTGAAPAFPSIQSDRFMFAEAYYNEEDFLNDLNQYGAQAFWTEYQKSLNENLPFSIQAYRDLTNDGFPELAIGAGNFYIFGCKDGHYVTLLKISTDIYSQAPSIIKILDANRNGIPEMSILVGFFSQGSHWYQVLEWDGHQFENIVKTDNSWSEDNIEVEASGNLVYGDIDRDGFLEYIVNIGIPVLETYQLGIPWRQEQQIYKWDGDKFIFFKNTFSPPEYRFQAVQDGDRAARDGDYDRALAFYQQAIYSNTLGWWSPERRNNVSDAFFNSFGASSGIPASPPPEPDPEEYDSLAAYSRYRIMLLDLSRGWESDAAVLYKTIQEKYMDGKPGHIYAVLAENVWDEFSKSGDLGKACNEALDFAANNQDSIFYYLSGSGFPGNHGIYYETDPLWICPY